MSTVWFAILSVVVGLGCVCVCALVLRQVPSSHRFERAAAALRRGRALNVVPGDDLLDPGALTDRIERARSRNEAIAELNEFVSEVSRQLAAGVRVPGALARASFASGALFAVLAIADVLATQASAVMVTPALVSLGAGLASGGACLQIGRAASKRRQGLRAAAEALRRELERRVPYQAGEPAPHGFGGS